MGKQLVVFSMKRYHFSFLFLIAILLGLNSCKQDPKPKDPIVPDKTKTEVIIPSFNSDSAFFYIEKQLNFGPRVPNTQSHANCAIWLTKKLKEYTSEVIVQQFKARAYNNQILNGQNIIASFNPEATKRILLCAHWDTRPYADYDSEIGNFKNPIPGANDGGSGVGVLLEIARQMSISKPKAGIDIILFDLEDYGEPSFDQQGRQNTWCLGSQYWAKNPHNPSYFANYGILLDMVGAKDAIFTWEATSRYYARNILNKVWGAAEKQGYGQYFKRKETGPVTDDHQYINELINIPTIDIIHYDHNLKNGFFDHWHTMEDDLENIDKNTLKAVGQTVMYVIYNE